MFFLTYLRRELRRRMRQSIFIALGLALGIGLVVTVTAASAGVKKAQADVLRTLYGIGTDVTVTGKPPSFKPPGHGGGGISIQAGAGGVTLCQNGKCGKAAGQTINSLSSDGYAAISQSKVAQVAALRGVKAAAGGLVLRDTQFTFPNSFGQPGGSGRSNIQPPASFTVDGVDVTQLSLGPLSAGTLTAGRMLTAAEANANAAVIDSGYARSHKLAVGSTVKVAGTAFRVVGIVAQPQGASPAEVYIPLARAQALGTAGSKHLAGKVNAIYVTAASAADIPAVQREVQRLLPGDTVTTAASLASQVTGSVADAATLANKLGKWLSVLVLIAAFAVACLLTLAAVARRVREFGTLKALGWRSRRITAQVMGESVIIGIIGGAAGVALGLAGAAIINRVAPTLTATVPSTTGPRIFTGGGPGAGPVAFGPSGGRLLGQAAGHPLSVPMSASVTLGAILAAVVLALAGGLLAGSFGSWRIARLRPADALAKVA